MARRCFPCIDEPAAKAIFRVTLVISINQDGLSNMPESRKITTNKGKKHITFLDTPIMSTYLLAICVGKFDFVQASTQSSVLVRALTLPGESAKAVYALDVAVKALELFNEFFGVPYPLPKLDMIAIPEFAAGAMENWGLITYRAVDLLLEEPAPSWQKQRVAVVVAHELSHQWFGNLVTMSEF
jgi:aminopeptidase N